MKKDSVVNPIILIVSIVFILVNAYWGLLHYFDVNIIWLTTTILIITIGMPLFLLFPIGKRFFNKILGKLSNSKKEKSKIEGAWNIVIEFNSKQRFGHLDICWEQVGYLIKGDKLKDANTENANTTMESWEGFNFEIEDFNGKNKLSYIYKTNEQNENSREGIVVAIQNNTGGDFVGVFSDISIENDNKNQLRNGRVRLVPPTNFQ